MEIFKVSIITLQVSKISWCLVCNGGFLSNYIYYMAADYLYTVLVVALKQSVKAATSHENMATVTALNYTLYRISSAVCSAVSGATWTQTLYKQLLKGLKDVKLATNAYASPYVFITDYEWGTPEKHNMVHAYRYDAYRYVQRLETIVAWYNNITSTKT
ncbi:hypothetical protein MOUN0_D06216 [Monosporozyma unispora]|nr:Siderophore transporter [Kazachstania unispora]